MQNNQFITPLGDVSGKAFLTEYYILDYYVGDKLFSWGINDNGQLGVNDGTARYTPVTTFAGGTNWRNVSSGIRHAAAIKTDGTLWTWGRNNYGQLGTDSSTFYSVPVTTFAGGTDWRQVECGHYTTMAVKTDGTLWVWGDNRYGLLGVNHTTVRITPVTTFAGGNNWKQISCGDYFSAAIKTDGTLWTWGRNQYGQLGVNDTTANRTTPVTTFAGGTNWKQVSVGSDFIAATKTDGTLWTWGSNDYGELGVNDTITRSTPVTTFAGGTNWKNVTCASSDHTIAAIKTDGSLWLWGRNANGYLGINELGNDRSTPVTTFAGGNNWKSAKPGFAVKTDGTLWTWGPRVLGGTNYSSGTTLTPVTTFAGGDNWKQVDSGGNSTYAVQSGSTASAGGAAVTTETGQAAYTTVGSFSWTCPAGVYDVSVVCVSGGGGGGPNNGGNGGSLAWKNAIPVSPGQSYTVVVGRAGPGGSNDDATRAGGDSYFISLETVGATGSKGYSTSPGPTYGDGGGLGGQGYWSGGGAGGYSGNGGSAGTQTGSSGSGGGGGAYGTNYSFPGLNGGGVGILGEGTSGGIGQPGSGGSGSLYGGGGGCGNGNTGGSTGGQGAVRIIWGPDSSRAFPSTNTGDM